MPKPPKVVFFTSDYPPDFGGLQTYSWRIAAELPGNLFWVEAYAARHSHPPRARADQIHYRFHSGRSRLGALAWSVIASVRHALGTDVFLHMQWSTALGSCGLRKLGGPRYVVLAHGAELLDANRPLNWIKRSVLRQASFVVAGSQATADLLENFGIPKQQLRVLHYGCQSENFPPRQKEIRPSPVRLACMHRLVPRKGTLLLLETLVGLMDRAWTLDIAGDGEETHSLKNWVQRNNLSQRVHFLPVIPENEKATFLQSHHLFILPSLAPEKGSNHMEGLGIALLEAQAAGVAVLAARTGGIPEAVCENKTGWLFEPGNREDLRVKLRMALDQPEVLSALGKAGAAWVAENFSWDKTMQGLSKIISEAMEAE